MPDDTRDVPASFTFDEAGDEQSPDAKSIAIQKSVAVVTDTGAAGVSPGDVLEYTLKFQVSDYFAVGDLDLTDILSDGQRLDVSFVPKLQLVAGRCSNRRSRL